MSETNRTVRVASKNLEAADIFSFELVDLEGEPLPNFSAGSHVDVHVADGLVRQYSLCNDPEESHRYLIAVLREPTSRGGSTGMHAINVGDTLTISNPRNNFQLAHDAAHSVLLAGGIGITPILCMAERLSNIGASFELHYCTRSAQRTAFIDRIRSSKFSSRAFFHHDDGPQSQSLDIARLVADSPPDTHLYVCGPNGFMGWALQTASAAGWGDQYLHREYFAAAPIDTAADDSFEIQLASSGATIRVAPNETVVEALSKSGIVIPTSCEQGVCGTCITRILEGIPEHRDVYLTSEEQAKNDQFAPCCSRSKSSKLVLDL